MCGMCGEKFSSSNLLWEHCRTSHPPPGMVSSEVAIATRGHPKIATAVVTENSDVITIHDDTEMETEFLSHKNSDCAAGSGVAMVTSGDGNSCLVTSPSVRNKDNVLSKSNSLGDNVFIPMACSASTSTANNGLVPIATMAGNASSSVEIVSLPRDDSVYHGSVSGEISNMETNRLCDEPVVATATDKSLKMNEDTESELDTAGNRECQVSYRVNKLSHPSFTTTVFEESATGNVPESCVAIVTTQELHLPENIMETSAVTENTK